ncbi:hypothetical protein GHT06_022378 [Daphnia sinensis]|uniref:Sidestep protein n=1 Tax=Daphnia sinensis TaxID=1820382 RepID=A0AAD5KXR5_9CRUS|nr:hypothetical protein GHT06_022378 [Daphnia sinensis]
MMDRHGSRALLGQLVIVLLVAVLAAEDERKCGRKRICIFVKTLQSCVDQHPNAFLIIPHLCQRVRLLHYIELLMHYYFHYAAIKLETVTVLRGRTAELPCDITPPTLDSLYLSDVFVTAATTIRPSAKLVDYTYIATSETVVQNVLVIPKLERRHLHAILRCQASNYYFVRNETLPFAVQPYWHQKQHLPSHPWQNQHTIISNVQLDLNLRPLWVVITGAEKPLSAGKSYTFECVTGGSRPSVNLRWYLHSVQQPAKERVTMDGSNTTSILKLIPTAQDHGAELICSAVNPLLVASNGSFGINASLSSIETHRKLTVHYAPIAELELGRNLKPDSIVEGNDIYFECRIKSNPAPHRFVWTHEGNHIKENASAGVIITEHSLVIRRVSRSHSGRYSCSAANAEGTGISNIVHLLVMFLPVCHPGQKILYGVAKQETAVVHCQTDAIPPAFSFRWSFNTSSTDVNDLQENPMFQTTAPNDVSTDTGSASVLSYSPQSDRDYGSLICWARNAVGEQREPCVYRIFAGVRPDPPSNCTVLNQTADAVEVWCRPGFDGGHPQLFQFEIFDTQSAVLLYNKSGRYPHLRVGNLESGVKLFIQISSYNRRGRSALVPLEAYTIKIAEKQTVIMETMYWASMMGIIGGVSASILIVCLVVAVTIKLRRQNNHAPERRNPNKIDKRVTTMTTNAVYHQHDPDDPDIIINSNSVQEQRPAQYQDGSLTFTQQNIAKRDPRENRSVQRDYGNQLDKRVDRDSLNESIVVNQPRIAVNRVNGYHHQSAIGTVETIVVKSPHRQRQNVRFASVDSRHQFS